MLKISALNEESSDESDEDNTPTITNEAQVKQMTTKLTLISQGISKLLYIIYDCV